MAKICDRCGTAAIDEVIFRSTDEHFDICLSCSEKLREVLANKQEEPKKRGRKKGLKKSS